MGRAESLVIISIDLALERRINHMNTNLLVQDGLRVINPGIQRVDIERVLRVVRDAFGLLATEPLHQMQITLRTISTNNIPTHYQETVTGPAWAAFCAGPKSDGIEWDRYIKHLQEGAS